MFEDLEDFLNENKKPVSDDGSNFERNFELSGKPQAKHIAAMLSKALGGSAKVEVVEEGKMGLINTDKLKDYFDGVNTALMLIGKATKAKPSCTDAKGDELKVGDYLKCSNKEKKRVLELGYGFCRLSRTDNFKVDDGFWYQTSIKRLNFIKE